MIEGCCPSPPVDRRPAPEPWRARSRSWSRGSSRRQAATGYDRAADPDRSRAGNPPDRRGAARARHGLLARVPSAGWPDAPRSARSAPPRRPTGDRSPSIRESSPAGAPIWPPLPSRQPAPRPAGIRRRRQGRATASARAAREPASSRWCRRCRSLPATSPAVSRRVRASAGPARPSSRARPARTASAALNRSATAARSLASARSRSSNRSRLPAATSCRADARCARPVAATRRPRACS